MNKIKETFKERVDVLYSQIIYIKSQLNILEKIVTLKNLIKYPEFMLIQTDAIATSVIVKMANLLDENKTNESITLYYIFNAIESCKEVNENNYELIKYIKEKRGEINNGQKTLRELLKKYRDKSEAHLDKSIVKEKICEFSLKKMELIKALEKFINDNTEMFEKIYMELFKEDLNYEKLFKRKLEEQIEKITTVI